MNRAPAVLQDGLVFGEVFHRRFAPVEHAFRYRFYQALLDLDRLPELDREVPLFGWNRPALLSFYDRDHLGGSAEPLRGQLERWVQRTAGESLPRGRILLLTQLRVCGFVFNPVSYFYCHDERGALARVVVEVNNTFGERLCHLLRDDGSRPGQFSATADKALHVSPFIGMDARYHFRLSPLGARVAVHIDETRDGGKFFEAAFAGLLRPFVPATLLRAAFAYPLMTLRVVWLIHWQALRLWSKKAPFFAKPAPVDNHLREPS